MRIPYLPEEPVGFPPIEHADERGIVAAGGSLSADWLIEAYSCGIFPWYNPNQPILWWCPDPRFVLFPAELKIQKSMRPYLNQAKFGLSYDEQFEKVIEHCQQIHLEGQGGTWITRPMIQGYLELHERGLAHSVEVWKGKELVGGLYGVSLGKVFFGESMFAVEKNASKYGFINLVKALQANNFQLIDCQVGTKHLARFGARYIPRVSFLDLLQNHSKEDTLVGNWGDIL